MEVIPGALKDIDRKKLIKKGFKFLENKHGCMVKAKIPTRWTFTKEETGNDDDGYITFKFYDKHKKLYCKACYGWSYYDGTYAWYNFDV